MFPNLCVQIYSFGLGLGSGFSTFKPNLVHSTTHSSCVTVTLHVTDEQLFKHEGPLTHL